MKKNLKIIISGSFILSIICPILYNVIGSKVLEDGTLDEPFYLVMLMWLFLAIFIISLIIYMINFKKKNK